MAIDITVPLSRRALVSGSIGALGATLLSAVARPLGVAAANDSVNYSNDTNDETVLSATSAAGGVGVRGKSDESVGVVGESTDGWGVGGTSTTGIGVVASSRFGVGLRGDSTSGRGAVLSGPKAPLRLVPSTKASHPPSGSIGDLFVDKHHRLWFCRGGTNWHRLV